MSIIKKLATAVVCGTLAASMLATTAFAKKSVDDIVEPEVLDFVTTETIVTSEPFDFDLTFEKMNDSFKLHKADHPGTDMFIHYQTDAYGDGVTYDKWCRVYLPYGYDQNDTETKYNVIYFQHGNNGNPNNFFDHTIVDKVGYGVKNIFDNMMDPEYGVMEPCIIVCPTYYFYAPEDKWNTAPTGDLKAGDGRDGETPALYHREIVEDLIPAVESQLNTYLEDSSEEGIIATRDHRMFSGYSRGSCCTWYVFHYDLPYFAYWMPMSADVLRETVGIEDERDNEDNYQYLVEAIEANPEYDFFIYSSGGGDTDGAGVSLSNQIKGFLDHENCVLSYGLDPEVNNFYFTRSDFDHNDIWMPYTLFNARNTIFNGEVSKSAAAPAAEAAPVEEAAVEEAAPVEEAAAAPAEVSGEYTQIKVFDGTYGFGDAEITVLANADLTAFDITFECFDEDQELIGTVADGIVTVEYDETGFMSGDAQLIWDDACASENPWEVIE